MTRRRTDNSYKLFHKKNAGVLDTQNTAFIILSNKQQATSNKQQATSNKQQATSNKQRS